MAITLRQESAAGATTKGDSLTFAELDNNFIDVLQNKIQALDVNGDTGQSTVGQALANEKVTIAGGTGISTAVTTDSAGETTLTITNTVAADGDTTYTLNAQTDGSNANINLAGSDASTDTIQLVAGTGISLSVDSAGAITLTNTVADTDTDTTYTINAAADGSNVNFNLAGSDASTDTIQFVAGSNITLTTDSAGAITIAATDTDTGILNVVEDTTPQLGGDLDGQGNKVENVELDDYKETIYTGGSTTGTITPDVANGNVQSITLTGSITLNAFANAETGQSMTMIIKQPASGGPYTLTSTMNWAGGTKTLSTDANAVDIVSILYDGTNYYASLSTNFS